MDNSGAITVHGVGLAWRNAPGQTTNRPRGVATWQINLFHQAMLLRLPGGERRCEAPTAICYAPGQAQWYRGAEGGFSDDWLTCSGPLQRLLEQHSVPLNQPFHLGNAAAVEGCLRELRRELDLLQPFANEAVTDLLRGLVRLLARGRQSDPGRDPRQQAIQRLRELLRERCFEAWTVTRMAAEVGLGAHRFAVLYRRWAGSSPLRELTSFRMRRAQLLLERDGASVAAVAKACGFADALYFSRVFRRWTGVPPSEHPRRPALRARAPASRSGGGARAP